jgi:putative membrane protein
MAATPVQGKPARTQMPRGALASRLPVRKKWKDYHMLMRTKAVLAAASAMMLAGAVQAAPPTPIYLKKAGAGDLYEKTSSQIVLGSTRNPDVRRFAGMMVTDHNKSTAMVKSAARRSGVRVGAPMLDPMQRRMVAELRRANGRDRDRLYIDQQRQAHSQALQLQQDYAATGSAPALRRIAATIVPVVQHHIDMLGRLGR